MAAKIKTVRHASVTRSTQAACLIEDQNVAGLVGRTLWSAADALVGLCGPAQKAGHGARCRLMEQEGIRQVLILPFTREVAQLTPEQFVRGVLVEALDAKAVLVGENFRFGHKHAGDTRLLRELGAQLGFRVEVLPGLTLR